MLDWMLMPYKRYADFSGRSRRKEYWMFYLFVMIVYFVLMMISGFGAASMTVIETGEVSGGGLSSVMGIVLMLFWVATIIPSIAVSVRRCHDQDKSGWFILVPIYGIILMFLEGTRGPNRFGPDPKAEENASPVA